MREPKIIVGARLKLGNVMREPKIIVGARLKLRNVMRSNVYDSEGIARTIMASDYKDPLCILTPPTDIVNQDTSMNEDIKLVQIGNAYPRESRENPQRGRIYDTDGVSPSIQTFQGGGLEPHILGYTRDHTGKKKTYHRNEVANTINTCTGSGGSMDQYVAEPNVLCSKRTEEAKMERKIKGDKDVKFSGRALEPRTDGICNTLTTVQKDNLLSEPKREYRVRKLTERECFRLMDVSDEDIDKIQAAGISRTQQYKMAGNSIVVNCLYKIFSNMFITTEPESDGQLTLPL